MAAIVFPLNPLVGQQHIAGGRAYTFSGESWSTGSDSLVPNQFTQVVTPGGSNYIYNSPMGTQVILLDPPFALNNMDVKLPPNPTSGQKCVICSSKGILILGVQDATGDNAGVVNHPGSLGVGGRLEYIFSSVTNKWVCISGFRGKMFMQPKVADFTTYNTQPGFGNSDARGMMLVQAGAAAPDALGIIYQNISSASDRTWIMSWDVIEMGKKGDAASAPAIGMIARDSTTNSSVFFSTTVIPGTIEQEIRAQYYTNEATPAWVFATRTLLGPIKSFKLVITDHNWNLSWGNGDGFGWNQPQWSYYLPSQPPAPAHTKVDQIGIGFKSKNDMVIVGVTQFGFFK